MGTRGASSISEGQDCCVSATAFKRQLQRKGRRSMEHGEVSSHPEQMQGPQRPLTGPAPVPLSRR